MLRANPNVEYASRNIYLYALGIDERYAEQWALDYSEAFEAWGLFTGSSDIVVAIIDNGMEFSHPDLQSNIWLNPGENGLDGYGNQRWNNGIDDDFNGKTDDYRGWDFGQGDNDPSHDSNDNSSHGTEMAGNIGATWNDEGIRGINQSVSLMILKFTNTFPPPVTSKASHFINAIDYAISNGASIISCSQGFKTTDTGDDIKFEYLPFKQAIQRAQSRGVLFVAAAGNDGNSIEPEENRIYPASYDEDNIISVLATTIGDDLGNCDGFEEHYWPESNYGAYSVDIGAPGHCILTTVTNGGYALASGTSQAAPQVAGVAALLLGKCPALTYSALKSRLMVSGDTLPTLQKSVYPAKDSTPTTHYTTL